MTKGGSTRKRQRGGKVPESGWGFGFNTLGTLNKQTFDTWGQPKMGPDGNAIRNVGLTQGTSVGIKYGYKGGAKRGGSRTKRGGEQPNNYLPPSSEGGSRTKRGGYWGSVLSAAAVPFTLWGAQYYQGKYARGKGVHTRRNNRRHG